MTTPYLADLSGFVDEVGKLARMLRDGFSLDDDGEDPIGRAKSEIESKGITREQRKVYKQGVSEVVYKAIMPADYPTGNLKELIEDTSFAIKEAALGRELVPMADRKWLAETDTTKVNKEKVPFHQHKAFSEDAWRLYLGLPQEYKTIGVSDYKPTQVKEGDRKYYFKHKEMSERIPGHYIKKIVGVGEKKIAGGDGRSTGLHRIGENKVGDTTFGLGRFQWSLGEDKKGKYIAYYDKWDFDVPFETLVGKPLEFYDRIYYDPKTYEPIRDKKK